MYKNDDDVYNIVKKKRLHKIAREISALNVSEVAVEKIQLTLNLLGEAMIKSADANARYNQRKTILEKDVDVALDNFYNYLSIFDKIYEEDFEQEDDFFF